MTEPETFDRYTLLRKLATGGMAEVFLARVKGPGGFEKLVVLKKILPELARDPTFTAMFMNEARLAATFSHPNVAQVFDFGEVDGTLYLTMEYVDGPTLRQVKKRAVTHKLELPFDVVAGIIARACEGLHYVHELTDPDTRAPLELVHRDISPDNLILSRNGQVKVLDFGIVKSTSPEAYTKSGSVRGKLAYMPPEQISAEPLDRRCDVWALGMVLYELLALHRPFLAEQDAAVMKAILFEPFLPLARTRPDVPKALLDIIDRCLAKDRAQRFATARQLQHALEQFIKSQSSSVGSYEIENFVKELSEGRSPRQGAATVPMGLKALDPLQSPRLAATVAEPLRALKVVDLPAAPPEPTNAQPSLSGPTDPDPTIRSSPPVTLAVVLVLVAGLALAGGVAWWRLTSTSAPVPVAAIDAGPPAVTPTPPPPTEPVDAGPAAEATADAGLPAVDAGAPAPADAGAVAVDAGVRVRKTKVEARAIPAEVRVLPEGEAQVDGAAFTSGALKPGAHRATFTSKRFGTIERALDVPACEGRLLIGYSFGSDRLTVTCKP